jgi:hypothetical protein
VPDGSLRPYYRLSKQEPLLFLLSSSSIVLGLYRHVDRQMLTNPGVITLQRMVRGLLRPVVLCKQLCSSGSSPYVGGATTRLPYGTRGCSVVMEINIVLTQPCSCQADKNARIVHCMWRMTSQSTVVRTLVGNGIGVVHGYNFGCIPWLYLGYKDRLCGLLVKSSCLQI